MPTPTPNAPGGLGGTPSGDGPQDGASPVPSDGALVAVIGANGGSDGSDGPNSPSGRPGGPPGGSRPGGHETWGPLTSALGALGLSNSWFGGLTVGPMAITATGSVALAMAFGLFGKRRRAGEPPASDEQLAAAAALGLGGFVVPRVIPGREPENPEAQLPRWLRPSLLQARKADPIRDPRVAAAPLAFSQGLVGPTNGRERRRIRHRVVRMLDTPDELRGAEIGCLDRGDEVELVAKHSAYWLILCPNGSQGWVHNMTLGEVIADMPSDAGPIATMPHGARAWTMGEPEEEDTNLLDTYLEAHRREA
jgi:hypothetical protein